MKKNKKKEFIIIGIFLLVLLILFLILNWFSPMLLWDENVYLGNARSHISNSAFTEDFRFPLLEYLIAFAWFFSGESIFIAQLIIILFSLASVFFLYLISKRFFSERFSFLLCFFFALCPLILFWGFRAYADIPAMFFVILSFYFLLKSEKNNKIIFLALAGFVAALAFLTRFPTALFALSAGLYFIFKKRFKDLGIFTLFFIVALLPWLTCNYLSYGNFIWDLQEQYLVISKWTSSEPIIKQITNLFVYINFLIPLLLLLGIYVTIRKNEKFNLLILIYVILSFIYYLFFVRLKDARYYLTFLPFIYLISFQGLYYLKKKKIFRYVFMILIIILVLNTVFIFGYLAGKNYCEKNSSITQSINYLKGEVDVDDVVLSNVWPWFGYHLNVKVFSLWDKNIGILLETYEPVYVVYCDGLGIEYEKEILDNSTNLKLEQVFRGRCGEKVYIYRVI
ncbi:MAG: glycosyltransferase family 39 protein [Candidatus Pacearchaeota archaeon]|nr:MAG: glycosyltransferase family 39 protein [Candidatus Pacearchaeota archaeon]